MIYVLRAVSESGAYPSVTELLHIFATLPFTHRGNWQKLKYFKNYLRSTTFEERLNGPKPVSLIQLYINRDIHFDHGAVINAFGKFNRRLSFV